jgi:hypothetical protein
MSTTLTRRQLAASLLAATPLLAQTPAPQTQPQALDDATAVRDKLKSNIEQIRKFDLPVATEPSFIFQP